MGQKSAISIFGSEVTALPAADRIALLDAAVRHWRMAGFPYPRLSSRESVEEFERLCRTPFSTVLVGKTIRVSTVGLRLANSFHPQLWRIRVHGRSPFDTFGDDDRLRHVLEKAAHFWPSRRCWNAQCVRSVLRTYHRTRYSNFRPTAARVLTQRFCRNNGCVLDFAAGFGGRLLGVAAAGYHYIGIDPARRQVVGLRRMGNWLADHKQTRVKIYEACAEDLLPKLKPNSVDLVLTSPPYFDVEKYSNEPTQSYVRYPTYEVWRQRFFEASLIESARVLRPGGYLVMNVKDTSRATVATDAALIGGRLLRHHCVLRLAMTCTPADRAKGKYVRFEPVLVFRKV